MVKKFKFEEKKYALEIDGKRYEIFPRTAEREKRLKEHDSNIGNMSEFEANMQLLEILLGRSAVYEIFNEGENTSLDKLEAVTACALELYMAEHKRIREEKLEKRLSEVEPLLKQVQEASRAVSDIASKTKEAEK